MKTKLKKIKLIGFDVDGVFTDGNYTFDTDGNVSGLGTVGCGAITSSGNLAVTGTITMITGGKIIDNVNTPFSLGYINLLGFIVFVPVTMIMARLGAKAVYKIDKKILSKIFGTFLILVSIRSFLEYLSIN